MANIANKIKSYISKKNAATSIEYGLIAAGIALAIAMTSFAFGDSIDDTFNNFVSTQNNIETDTATAVDPATAGD